jgi:two-component system sensor histidine kinase MtrB
LATLTIAVTTLAVLVAGALVVLTTALRTTTARSTSSVESVRLAEEAEIDLLLHERARDQLVKRAIEADLLRRLHEARFFVTTDEESRVLAEAVTQAEAYVAVARDPRSDSDEIGRQQQAAYAALENLVAINVAHARRAQRDAARWDDFANMLGIAVGAVVLVFAGGPSVAEGTRIRTRHRAGGGHGAIRVRGSRCSCRRAWAREIRDMCTRFNEMASSIAAQRQAQMAFLGGVAHDLRNPLNALQLSIAMLGRDRQLPSEERLRQTIDRIARQTARMDRMLGDFLDLARIEAGQLELRIETHDAVRSSKESSSSFRRARQISRSMSESRAMLFLLAVTTCASNRS